jgi:hypothetical protein
MAWPINSSNIVTTNLDSSADSPAAARANLKSALDELANVINGRGQASGVAPLDASSKIASTYLPDEINSSAATDLTLDPATNIVTVENIVKLTPQTIAQLQAEATPADGMIAFCSDGGDSALEGVPVYYSAGQWRDFRDGSIVA